MDPAGNIEHQQVHIWGVTKGTPLTTYAMRGERNRGVTCINGAVAQLVTVGDIDIITTFARVTNAEAKT